MCVNYLGLFVCLFVCIIVRLFSEFYLCDKGDRDLCDKSDRDSLPIVIIGIIGKPTFSLKFNGRCEEVDYDNLLIYYKQVTNTIIYYNVN